MRKYSLLCLLLLICTMTVLLCGCGKKEQSKENQKIETSEKGEDKKHDVINNDDVNKEEIASDAIVIKLSDYGAVGDGVTDDSVALGAALDAARVKGQDGSPVILEFEKDKSYYFKDGNAIPGQQRKAIFPLDNYKNFTVRGDNTTLLLDRTNQKLCHWFKIDRCKNIKIEGFNLKWSKDDYVLATVDKVSLTDNPYIDVTTDGSLGITGKIETLSAAFAMPYLADSNGMHLNRMHLYIKAIEPLDIAANKYRIHVNPIDQHVTKINYVVEHELSIILGIPGWAPYVGDNGSGGNVVTSTENIELARINVWDSPGGVFHMRYNTGVVYVHDSNVTSEPGTDDLVASWRDIFHLKDNRAKFIIEDCVFEKSYDDVFNFSVTYMEVIEVVSNNEAKMSCEQTNGYWSPIKVGDVITFVDEGSGYLVGRTRVKEVIQQGVTTHLILEDEMPRLKVGVSVYVDSLGQTGSIIRNCKVNGTYRFRTEITVEDCELNTMYAWIDNSKRLEGPIPRNITFRRCDFNPVKADDLEVSFGGPYIMRIGASSSGMFTLYYADNIVFEDCDIDYTLIDFKSKTANVSFIRNGEEYYRVKAYMYLRWFVAFLICVMCTFIIIYAIRFQRLHFNKKDKSMEEEKVDNQVF